MSKKDKGGRPTVMTQEKLQKLEDGFMKGLSDEMACLYAGIATTTLYGYQKANPSFKDRKHMLKQHTKMKARLVVATKAEKDPEFALRYLERVDKAEFSTRSELTGADGEKLQPPTFNIVKHKAGE